MAVAYSLVSVAFDAFWGTPVRPANILWEAVVFGVLFGFSSWFMSRDESNTR